MSALMVGQCQVLDVEKSIVITRVADDQKAVRVPHQSIGEQGDNRYWLVLKEMGLPGLGPRGISVLAKIREAVSKLRKDCGVEGGFPELLTRRGDTCRALLPRPGSGLLWMPVHREACRQAGQGSLSRPPPLSWGLARLGPERGSEVPEEAASRSSRSSPSLFYRTGIYSSPCLNL